MARYDLAGNPLPEPDGASPPSAPPREGMPPGPAPFVETRRPTNLPPIPAPGAIVLKAPPAPARHVPAPAPPAAPLTGQSILTRGVVQETPAQKLRAYAGLLATFVVLIIATYAVAAIPSPRVPAPVAYVPVTSPITNVLCDGPTDWNQHVGTQTGIITLKQKSAIIQIDGGPADAGDSNNPAPSVDDLHTQNKDMVAERLGDTPVVEQAAQPLAVKMGEARVTEWTAKAELTQLHGYRATLLGNGLVALVFCKCSERDWVTLKPAFLHIIQSITPATVSAAPGPTGGQ